MPPLPALLPNSARERLCYHAPLPLFLRFHQAAAMMRIYYREKSSRAQRRRRRAILRTRAALIPCTMHRSLLVNSCKQFTARLRASENTDACTRGYGLCNSMIQGCRGTTYALSLASSSGSQFPFTLATGWRRFFLWLEESLPEPAAPSEQRLR